MVLLRLGFAGNHPFSTRFFCSKISPMVHNDEKEKTPRSDDQKTSPTITEAAIPPSPSNRKHHQHPVPK